MRKSVTFFLIALAMIIWNGGTVFAGDYSIRWWHMHKRTCEDGRVFNRLAFGVIDSSGNYVANNVVKTVTLIGPSGPITLPAGPPDFLPHEIIEGGFDGNLEQWHYDPDFHFQNYFSYDFSGDIQIGNHTLTVVDLDDDTMFFYPGLSETKYFNGIVNLPEITSKSFRGYEDASGNLLWFWDVPMDTYFWASEPDVDVLCWVNALDGESIVAEIYVGVPSTMGMMFVPSNLMNKLKLKGDNFRIGLHLRTKDNNNRYHSNEIQLTSLKKKRNNVVVVPMF